VIKKRGVDFKKSLRAKNLDHIFRASIVGTCLAPRVDVERRSVLEAGQR
jgi:hypothetical protein